MIKFLVSQAFPAPVVLPLPKEGLQARPPVLINGSKKRIGDLLTVMVFGECLATHIFVLQYFFRERIYCIDKIHRLVLAVELDLLIDDIVNELTLDDELGSEVLEPPDFFGINNWLGFDIRGDVFKIVLVLAPVPDPVFRERPGIYLEEKFVQVWHRVVLERMMKYIRIRFCQCVSSLDYSYHPYPLTLTTGRSKTRLPVEPRFSPLSIARPKVPSTHFSEPSVPESSQTGRHHRSRRRLHNRSLIDQPPPGNFRPSLAGKIFAGPYKK